MKRIKLFLFLLVLFILAPFFSQKVSASTIKIDDQASLYSDSDKANLEKTLSSISKNTNMAIIIATTDDLNGITPSEYAESIASNISETDKFIFFVSMDNSNRRILIQGHGKAEDLLTSKRCDEAANDVKQYFTDQQYYKGTDLLLSKIDTYLHKNPKLDAIYFQLWFQILVSLAIGAVIVIIMALSAGGKMTAFQGAYLDNNASQVLGRYDHYLRTEVTRTKRESSSNDNSSGSSGHSEGGSSF
ncbi:hypothetical protein lbkm_3165 [Lachnospiraceae bacterium KM106-2]|nr:hypothetical protein lbkm_3165 [Lachnospiraceae bacterium KM106-2]